MATHSDDESDPLRRQPSQQPNQASSASSNGANATQEASFKVPLIPATSLLGRNANDRPILRSSVQGPTNPMTSLLGRSTDDHSILQTPVEVPPILLTSLLGCNANDRPILRSSVQGQTNPMTPLPGRSTDDHSILQTSVQVPQIPLTSSIEVPPIPWTSHLGRRTDKISTLQTPAEVSSPVLPASLPGRNANDRPILRSSVQGPSNPMTSPPGRSTDDHSVLQTSVERPPISSTSSIEVPPIPWTSHLGRRTDKKSALQTPAEVPPILPASLPGRSANGHSVLQVSVEVPPVPPQGRRTSKISLRRASVKVSPTSPTSSKRRSPDKIPILQASVEVQPVSPTFLPGRSIDIQPCATPTNSRSDTPPGGSISATPSGVLRELCLQNLPPEIVSIILGFVSEDELWRVRNLCHAFKAVYESSVRLKLLRLLPHIKSLITAQMETVENSMFSQEQLRLSQARKMLLLKYTYREALMFTAMVWRQSFDPGAWSAVCHSASRVLREFYSLADGAATWARILDFSSFYHRLQAWYAFQNTYTAQIEPLLAEDPNAETVPFSVQVVDVLECALFSNWESSIELSPSPRRTRKTSATSAEPRFDVEYWMRMRGEESRRGGCRGSAMLALTAFLDRADGTRPSQRAALLRFLRRAVADNTLAEFNRILDELEPLEVNVARSHAFAIPDQMVAEMSRVYAKVFQEYPQPWPSLRQSETEPGYRLTRHADYDMTQSQTQVRLSVRGVPQHLLPLSWTQESLRGAVRLAPPRRPPQAPSRPARNETPRRPRKGPSNVLTIETTRQERRDRFLKSSVTVRGLDQDLKITRRTKCFKLL